ncbi:pectin lyase fold protein, partial [Vibrio phage 1.046.O._10N.286.52.E3]
ATPGGLVDKQELIDAQLDTAHLGRVVNSKDASGAPISTSTNRTGGVNKTLDALEAEYQEAVDNAQIENYAGLWPDTGGSANKGETWQTQTGGTPTGQYFRALQNTTVDPVGDDVNWREVVSHESLSQYTDIVYKASGGNSAVENMLAGIPLQIEVGEVCKCENGTLFIRTGNSSGDISDYTSLNDPNTRDFGAVGGDTTKDTQGFLLAIAAARSTGAKIHAPATGVMFPYKINKRLYFGPLTEADTLLQPTQSRNICSGMTGDGENSTWFDVSEFDVNEDVFIDMSGLREKYLDGFSITSNSDTTCPNVGILTARYLRPSLGATTPTNNDFGKFSNVKMYGYYKFTNYLAHATEDIVVEQCRFYNKHDDLLGPWVSTSILPVEGYMPTESPLTDMEFITGQQSNLHQTHINCDYAIDTENPTRGTSVVAQNWIYGSLMVRVESPFYNNNAVNYDTVRVDRAVPTDPYIYGIHVINANYHQTVKSGFKTLCPTVNCSVTQSNRTVGFEDGAVVLGGFTTDFNSDFLDGDLVVGGDMINCSISSIRDLKWDLSYAIKNCDINVRGQIDKSLSGTERQDNYVEIVNNDTKVIVKGKYDLEPVNSALEVRASRVGLPAIAATSDNGSFDSSLLSMNMRTTSSAGFNHFECIEQGSVKAEMRKGGFLVFEDSTAGVVLRSANGTRYRLRVADNGDLSTGVL